MSDGAILIADDDANDVLLSQRVLLLAKISNPVQIVSHGEDAIRYLSGDGEFSDRKKYPFPILLALNLQMPRKTGGEVLAWLQTQSQLPKLKVVIVSGLPEPKQAQQAYHFGARYFIAKPPKADELLKIFGSMDGLKIISSAEGNHLVLIRS